MGLRKINADAIQKKSIYIYQLREIQCRRRPLGLVNVEPDAYTRHPKPSRNSTKIENQRLPTIAIKFACLYSCTSTRPRCIICQVYAGFILPPPISPHAWEVSKTKVHILRFSQEKTRCRSGFTISSWLTALHLTQRVDVIYVHWSSEVIMLLSSW